MNHFSLCVFFSVLTISQTIQRSVIVGESGSSRATDLFALRGDRVTLTYVHRTAAQSVTFGWFLSLGGSSTTLSAVPNPGRFSASVSGLTATLEFDFDASIPDGSSFRPLVTVTTVTNGIPSSSSSFAGSVIVKLGVIPKLQLDRISDVIAEGDPINISVNVIEGRPNPNVTLLNATRDQSLMLVALNSTLYQVRKASASISDGGVYRIEAMNAVGRDSINFMVTVCFLRLIDCNLCNANSGSTVDCTFSSSPKPIEVKFNNLSLVPIREADRFDNYVIAVTIPGQPRPYTLIINNGYCSPVAVECTPSSHPTTEGPTSTSFSSKPGYSTTPPPTALPSSVIALVAGCAAGGVGLIALLLLLLCPINLSCRRCLQGKCCRCCFKCYNGCCNDESDEQNKMPPQKNSDANSDVQLHPSPLYQASSKITEHTTKATTAGMPEYATISEAM
ncbi:uncharacterized protein [Oscarella lobularis]|uniref:uncharacterized protein isoform X2 n=1 Tax=Oscarella lobularis TaxID=121494 RepID=UPI0033130B6C